MKRFVFIVFVLLLFSTCGNKSKTFVPDRLLTEQEMIDIMTDVQIIEADLTRRKSSGTNTVHMAEVYYEQLFEHHNITDCIFAENIRYYTECPAVLERVMDSVVQRLTKVQSESQRDDSQ